MTRLGWLRLAGYMLVVVLGGIGILRVEHQNRQLERQQDAIEAETAARLEASCESGNEVRADIRRMVREGGIASGTAGGEALIQTVAEQGDATPEAIALYRSLLLAMLNPALTDIVNRLPARQWDPDTQECVDVPVPDAPGPVRPEDP